MFTSIIANGSSERTVCHTSHTPWSGCPFLLFCLIANSSSELAVCPCIAHAIKIWTVFDGSAIANILQLFWRFLHHRLRLLHRTPFRQRVSDRSAVLAVSYNSAWRLIQEPTSLSARILKADYFPSTDLLEVSLGAHPSQVWRAILDGRDTLVKVLSDVLEQENQLIFAE